MRFSGVWWGNCLDSGCNYGGRRWRGTGCARIGASGNVYFPGLRLWRVGEAGQALDRLALSSPPNLFFLSLRPVACPRAWRLPGVALPGICGNQSEPEGYISCHLVGFFVPVLLGRKKARESSSWWSPGKTAWNGCKTQVPFTPPSTPSWGLLAPAWNLSWVTGNLNLSWKPAC